MPSSHDALKLERPAGLDARRQPCTSRTDVFHLPALGSCVGEARGRLRALLAERGVHGEVGDDAGLVLSELFTNAVRYSDSERISCALRVIGDAIRIEVADQGRGLTEPQPRRAEVDEEGGRGLLLVNALATAWGVQSCPDGGGRLVWAVLRDAGASAQPLSPKA
ncbi:ATP-binding protein [Streptomyces sp. ICBB 8177]|uniref:ATP-binding protein n=1 Tax=Streptomyces sp. ICBB 8177 TaxID=563922 RepID=UPI001F5484FD|nr:ATP-binding protein [Streptomyces sp. ICBB 8177]